MRIGFTTMYSIFLGLAIIGILGAMCQYYKRGCGDFLVKCSWFFYGLIMLLGFLLSTVAYLMSITLMDGCRDFMPVLTNQTLFNEIAFITSPSQ